jgi:DNA-binding beta-propeller fold protein YncE
MGIYPPRVKKSLLLLLLILFVLLSYCINGCGSANNNSASNYTPTADPNPENVSIYIADYQNNRVLRITDMGGSNWSTYTNSNTISRPWHIAVDSSGRIYIPNSLNNRIIRINDISGAGMVTLGGPVSGNGINQFYEPSAIFSTRPKIFMSLIMPIHALCA